MSPGNEPSKICHSGKDGRGLRHFYTPPFSTPKIRDTHHIFPFSRFKRKYKVKLVEKRAFREIQ